MAIARQVDQILEVLVVVRQIADLHIHMAQVVQQVVTNRV